MSLMRLLTVGHSLNEMKDTSRYHVSKEHYLPTFGSDREEPSWVKKKDAVAPVVSKINNGGVASALKSCGSWLKKSNPFSAQAGARPVARNGAAKSAKSATSPVQSELSLEKVKVMRNDLNDSDLEIVSKRSETKILPANSPAPSVNDELGAKAWSWLATRLFGAS